MLFSVRNMSSQEWRVTLFQLRTLYNFIWRGKSYGEYVRIWKQAIMGSFHTLSREFLEKKKVLRNFGQVDIWDSRSGVATLCWYIVPHFSKDHIAFIFRVKQSKNSHCLTLKRRKMFAQWHSIIWMKTRCSAALLWALERPLYNMHFLFAKGPTHSSRADLEGCYSYRQDMQMAVR